MRLHYRQADAIVRYALVNLQFLCKGTAQGEVHIATFALHGHYLGHVFHYS